MGQDTLDDLCGWFQDASSGGSGWFAAFFEFLELADQAVRDLGDQEQGVFAWLQPHPVLLETPRRELWHQHVAELIERYASVRTQPLAGIQGAMAAPSNAEIIALLSTISLSAPLRYEYTLLYEQLFAEAFPDHETSKAAAVNERPDTAHLLARVRDEVRISGRLNTEPQSAPGGASEDVPDQRALEWG